MSDNEATPTDTDALRNVAKFKWQLGNRKWPITSVLEYGAADEIEALRRECVELRRDIERHLAVASEAESRAAAYRSALEDCANSLGAELKARFPAEIRKYPSMQADYNQEMSVVVNARSVLSGAPQELLTLNVFSGPPPEGYADWFAWAAALTKCGAFIRKAELSDWGVDSACSGAKREFIPAAALEAAQRERDWLLSELREREDITGNGQANDAMAILAEYRERFRK